MNSNTSRALFWPYAMMIIVAYFSIKLFGPSWVEYLYSHEQFDVLNKISGARENLTLDFYLGTFQENLLGPLSSVLSALFLIPFALIYLEATPLWRFTVTIFLFLVVTKFEVLFFPPWGDHMSASVVEGLWLARHNFDYGGLLHQEAGVRGGPKFFLFSLYPGMIALLIKFLPTVKSFLVLSHLLTFAMSAAIVGLFREILLKKLNPRISILTSLFLLALPLYQAMTEMIHMEIPTLFFAMFSVYYLCEKKISRASLFAILAVCVKGPGSIVCATVFLTCVLLLFFDPKFKFRFGPFFWGLLAVAFTLLQIYLRSKYVHDEPLRHDTVYFLIGLQNVLHSQVLVWSYLFILISFVVSLVKNKQRGSLGLFFKNQYVPIVMLIFITMWFALHVNLSVMGPRYKLIFAPFLIYALVFAVSQYIKSSRVICILLIGSILVAYFSSYGILYPHRIESKYYAYGNLHRSLEYRNDLLLHMKIADEIERNYSDYTIGAPHVTAQALAFKEFGYVTKPLDIMMYGMDIHFGGISAFSGLDKLNLYKTIWIGFISELPLINKDIKYYPIAPEDRIVKKIVVGDKKATLFLGGYAIERMRLYVQMRWHQVLPKRNPVGNL